MKNCSLSMFRDLSLNISCCKKGGAGTGVGLGLGLRVRARARVRNRNLLTKQKFGTFYTKG